jgi:N-acetyl-gamma-glutamyl-phosphate/LysW-gamma-L-alpha-aminoadipyl-6-phosphate reductase
MIDAAIVGGSGYTGGELIRLLLGHPEANLVSVTSESNAGKALHRVHPNLRKVTDMKFISVSNTGDCDVIFTALPHGVSMQHVPELLEKAGEAVIDLSADFRLESAEKYREWYGHEHACPELLKEAVYGIPETHRKEMRNARLISGAGCLATSTILALRPLMEVIDRGRMVIDSKVGSSASGNKASVATHHPERSHVVRSYMPTMHRHTAEMEQELAVNGELPVISFSPHAVELVRGILTTCHVFLEENLSERDVWEIYRNAYGNEPFIRLVKEKQGVYRYPEPKILTGSNFCDIGFELDGHAGNRLVVISAIDNLVKGAAGQAMQAMNVRLGFDETLGFEAHFGFHPI